MAKNKPTKPTNLMPRSFGGEKNNFSDDLIASGFEPNVPETYNGDNLNYQLNATGNELEYVESVVDYINAMPSNNVLTVNSNNQLDYLDASTLAVDNNVVHKTGDETIGDIKTFNETIVGSINGNANTATNDIDGNPIKTTYQKTANISQSIDDSETKYPSNNAVKTALEQIIPSQIGNAGKYLKTNGTNTIWQNALDYKNITNCILEAPSGVFVQNSDGYYMVPKGTRFLSADGTDINENIKNLDVTLTEDIVFSGLPTTSSGLIMLFLMSLDKTTWGIGLRDYKVQWFEQDTIPNIADGTWFNTYDYIWRNIQTADGDGKWYNFNTIPIALVNLTNGVVDKIYRVNSVIDLITNKAELANVDAVDLALPTTVPFNTLFQAPCNGALFIWSRLGGAANGSVHPVSRDCIGYLNASTAETGMTVNQEYTQVGTYTFNAPTTGWYNMILVGGGGNGIQQANQYLVYAHGGGGSGAAFAGQVYLTAGNHTITVGGANGASSIDGLVVAGGGGNASMNNTVSATAGGGGVLTVTGQTQNATIYSNGNAGATAIGSACAGGASLYNGWGAGAGSNGSPATGYAFISYQGSTSTITGTACYVNYVSVDWDGSANTVTAIHDSTSWINIEKGQTIKFVANIATAQTDMPIFNAQFYPKKVEMKN